MIVNTLLIRWAGGWREVAVAESTTTHGRREALLGLGALQSTAEVDRVAAGQFAVYANPRTEINIDLAEVDDDDRPYFGFGVGDTINVPDIDGTMAAERVVGLTASLDDDGRVTYAPDLKDVILTAQERARQNDQKMTAGSLGGDSKVAQPAALAVAPPPSPRPAPSAAASGPPTASLAGLQTLTDDYAFTGLTAAIYRQSPGMDGIVTIDEENTWGDGHGFVIHQPCDLLLTYSVHLNRGGSSGEFFFGVSAIGFPADTGVSFTDGGELFGGSWANSAFPSATQWVGTAQTRSYALDTIDPDPLPRFDPYAFIGGTGAARSFGWKLTLTLLERTSRRDLTVIT